ncbi:hypothetical protein LOK49_LG02G02012 [Camellia lanceoleosa]|uniref:Uncharacterized protein n=1 Tax=Camellia lanceoleosa TaxID=1840588 RepID=A0ACC0IVH2_9ERIC|nr:hypothetical protein LOK49_LG02G02012 [Camellia lanceoleosa]
MNKVAVVVDLDPSKLKKNSIALVHSSVANCKVSMEKLPYSLLPPLAIFTHFYKVLHSQSELDGAFSLDLHFSWLCCCC